jgi:cytochrome b561
MTSKEAKNPTRYSAFQKVTHWTLAILCVFEFPTALGIQRAHIGHAFGIKPPTRDFLMAIGHEWAGWLILGLAALLLAMRFLRGAPKLPSDMRNWQRLLAHANHIALYLGVFALVGSGVAAMYVSGRFVFVHIVLTKLGVALVSLHLMAVLWHQLFRRDDLLERLMPSARR